MCHVEQGQSRVIALSVLFARRTSSHLKGPVGREFTVLTRIRVVILSAAKDLGREREETRIRWPDPSASLRMTGFRNAHEFLRIRIRLGFRSPALVGRPFQEGRSSNSKRKPAPHATACQCSRGRQSCVG